LALHNLSAPVILLVNVIFLYVIKNKHLMSLN